MMTSIARIEPQMDPNGHEEMTDACARRQKTRLLCPTLSVRFKRTKPMALINCPECGKPVSTAAKGCPACGFPVAETVVPTTGPAGRSPSPDELLAEVRPSWWNYFWHWFFFFLIVPPIIAACRRASTILRVYPNRITLERGLFAKCYQDFLPRDIRSIDIDQGFLARMVGIGDITISTAATVEAAERIEGIPDPKGIRELILAQRRD
jgi:hypothetical protein